MPSPLSNSPPWITASAFSGSVSSRNAAREVAAALRAQCPLRPDALFLFASFHHRAAFASSVEIVRGVLHPEHLLACVVESVVEGAATHERIAGLSALAIHAPNVRITPWWFDVEDGPPSLWDEQAVRTRVGLDALHRGAIALSDPYSMNSNAALQALDRCAPPGGANIIGGVASGASFPGLNVMFVDHHITSSGIVGLSFGGALTLDSMLSQGCRAIGKSYVVTKAKRNILYALGGLSAIAAAQEAASSLGSDAAALLSQGLLVGVLSDEHAPSANGRFGRDQFLAREVLAVDAAQSSITINEDLGVGRTVQFLLRDAKTVRDDLAMQLDRELFRESADAALLFTCIGRERAPPSDAWMVGGSDSATIMRRLTAPTEGSTEQKRLPLCGFRAAGEFGRIGTRSFQHGQTAALALFRRAAHA
ncbi:MAG: hypothetical protein EXS10_04570 [Phycisphaerales bacterium]|nr:hypothetical protein [Phycisphaerales bacterium]